jgi:hypothetical protein
VGPSPSRLAPAPVAAPVRRPLHGGQLLSFIATEFPFLGRRPPPLPF